MKREGQLIGGLVICTLKEIKQKASNYWLIIKLLPEKQEDRREEQKLKKLETKEQNDIWKRKYREINMWMGGTEASEARIFIINLISEENQIKNTSM